MTDFARPALVPSYAAGQRGASFISLSALALLLAFFGYIVFKSLPVATEYVAVKRVLNKASEGSTVLEVQQNFERQAGIEYLDQYDDPLRAQDLKISMRDDRVVVRIDYVREVPLVGPAYLTYKLNASSQ